MHQKHQVYRYFLTHFKTVCVLAQHQKKYVEIIFRAALLNHTLRSRLLYWFCSRASSNTNTSCLCASAKPEPPVTTAIKTEKNVCKITFSPNIVQQAKITTNGNLGDFVIRYDVQRDMGIGDIQVLLIDSEYTQR